MRPILMLALFSAGACATLPAAVAPSVLTLRPLPSGAVVVITELKPPWYATRGLVVRTFRKLVPEYQALSGLERKSFTLSRDGRVGGVYLWGQRADAEAHFDETWHRRALEKYGVPAKVRFLDVTRALDGSAQPVSEGEMTLIIGRGPLERYAQADGLRAAFEGPDGVVSTWQSRAVAERFFAGEAVEGFDAPVELVNAR